MTKDSKILIVDDFAVMRRIVENLWRMRGYHVFVHAVDGLDAIEKLKLNPDIEFICSDWNMPKMSGMDFLKHVRANPSLKTIPFLMITAEARRSQILEAAQEGVDGYIVKPFTEEQLFEKINKILDRRGKA